MGVIHGKTKPIGKLRCAECGCLHTVARAEDGTLRSMEICPGPGVKERLEEIRAAASNETLAARQQLNIALEALADKDFMRALECLDNTTREITTVHSRIREELLR